MKTGNANIYSMMAIGMIAGLGMTAAQGCDGGGGPLGDLAEQCGLTCDGSFVEGQANISGIASIDAFFGAGLDLQTAMNGVHLSLQGELDAIAVSVGLPAGSSGADISAALQAHFAANLEGGISIEWAPPRCEASVEASVSAAAECDVEVDPGMVSASCKGSCEAEAGASVECSADAQVECSGTAPELACDGTCEGTCSVQLEAAASCEGTCNGMCDGECSLMNSMGECRGECTGMCTGECKADLTAGASCEGKCEGTCTYTPPDGQCEANAQVSCKAMGEASIECEGKCEGEVEPPEVSAECEASVEAKASASVECRPPELQIAFEFAAGVDADGQAEFRAWLEGFKGHFSAIIALRAQGNVILDAGTNFIGSGAAAIDGAIADLQGSADLKASIGAGCALTQVADVATAIGNAAGQLGGSVEASVQVIGSVG